MPATIDRDILLEALSALTGLQVKHHHEIQLPQERQIMRLRHFLPTVITKRVYMTSTSMVHDSSIKEIFVDIEEFFDPGYDYDFRDMKDSAECRRGGEEYTRPYGWYRFALKVLNQYPDGNAWLGKSGWRSESDPNEWPVSFHGTSIKGAEGITQDCYIPGDGQFYGRGIYSTPKIKEAERYTKKFTYKKTGKTYEVIMQNRINPQERKITANPDYWLIPVPDGSTHEKEKEIVTRSIRPYGILIKEV